MFSRLLHLELPRKQSSFLWGPRQTGKSHFLKINYPQSKFYDLLNTTECLRFTKNPHLLKEEVLSLPKAQLELPIIIDEFQKVPELLNEIHWLIENTDAQFILCGSSARKLKHASVNLLGGRAWLHHFFPLTSNEIPEFDLLKALQHGLLPKHYLASQDILYKHFKSYVDVYLTEEIKNEGIVRNLAGFARFLDVASLCNGELINYSNVARDCALDRNTVQNYFQILEDTFLGYFIRPFTQKIKRDLITSMPKFYLFDVGITNYIAGQSVIELKGVNAGRSFEHFILMELKAYIGMRQKRLPITYWRTKVGAEVDFILGKAQCAIEVKISNQVHQRDLSGLISFCEEHPNATPIVVSQDLNPRLLMINDQCHIKILPWKHFLKALWADELI